MDTKLFAIKISKREKDAMDFTAKVTGRTLSKLYYKPLQSTIHEILGLALLFKIDRRISITLKDIKNINFEDGEQVKLSIPIIEDFVEFMIEPNNRREFNELFDNVEFVVKDFLLYKLNVQEISRSIGRLYLDKHGRLDKINLGITYDIFFDYMLSLYYKLTAVGSLKNLNTEWYNKRLKIHTFETKLIQTYLNKYRDEKAEAIEIEEVLEVSEYRG
jgi:hypothetical protein